MAGAEETIDNEVEFGNVNNSWARLCSTFSGLSSCFWEDLTAILRTSDRCLGQRRITQRRHEASQKGKRAAQANSAATDFDTEWSKSLDFRSESIFCFLRLNLENRLSQNFNYWHNSSPWQTTLSYLTFYAAHGLEWWGLNVLSTFPLHQIHISYSVSSELNSWAYQGFSSLYWFL